MFADIELARRLERAEGFAGASFTAARGGASEWIEVAGCYAMFDGAASPLTQTFALGMLEPATDAVVMEVEAFFEGHKAPVMHEVCPLAGIPLVQSLCERHYRPFENSSVLFRELSAEPEQAGANEFSIRVASKEDMATYASVASRGWGETAEVAEIVLGMSQVMFRAEGYTGFLVDKGGQTIATAGIVIREGVALFAGGSTVPEARGLGAQRAVLQARLQYAYRSGCDVAMMVSEPGSASQRNAERCGFRIAYTRTKWRKDGQVGTF